MDALKTRNNAFLITLAEIANAIESKLIDMEKDPGSFTEDDCYAVANSLTEIENLIAESERVLYID